jgi:hypothetical protein
MFSGVMWAGSFPGLSTSIRLSVVEDSNMDIVAHAVVTVKNGICDDFVQRVVRIGDSEGRTRGPA